MNTTQSAKMPGRVVVPSSETELGMCATIPISTYSGCQYSPGGRRWHSGMYDLANILYGDTTRHGTDIHLRRTKH